MKKLQFHRNWNIVSIRIYNKLSWIIKIYVQYLFLCVVFKFEKRNISKIWVQEMKSNILSRHLMVPSYEINLHEMIFKFFDENAFLIGIFDNRLKKINWISKILRYLFLWNCIFFLFMIFSSLISLEIENFTTWWKL